MPKNLSYTSPSHTNPDVTGSQELTEEYIRLRAYQLYEQRGYVDGYDLEDWLQAEAEITGKKRPVSATPEPPAKRVGAAA